MRGASGSQPNSATFSALQRAENSSIRAPRAPNQPRDAFQCSSASRKFLNRRARNRCVCLSAFQCSSASRKFLNSTVCRKRACTAGALSVLFSEPKIPQSSRCAPLPRPRQALSVLFSEPKIPQLFNPADPRPARFAFSALQRAENSSISTPPSRSSQRRTFSALQRAENSSISHCSKRDRSASVLSVLFSEPKIPQCDRRATLEWLQRAFSALQRAENSSILRKEARSGGNRTPFSALQRAENSSIRRGWRRRAVNVSFQCSSASRKFLNSARPQAF